MFLPFFTEYVLIKNIFKEGKGIHIARPREIKLEQGTVYLQDLKTEVADKLEEHIRSFFNKETEDAPLDATKPVVQELNEKSIGIRVSPVTKKAQVVTIVYNGETGEAKVSTIVDADGLRDATNKFKMTAADLNFV